jgi:hypothetical protein
MALDPSTRYPSQTDADAGYPLGKARNAGSFQDGTGTPLERDWVNDLWGFEQALLDAAGISPSGDPDEVGASQYLDAVEAIAEQAAVAVSGGRLLARTILTSGAAATFNHHPDAKTFRVYGIGGGGAGGGVEAAAGSYGVGGGSATWGERTFTISPGVLTSTYTVGDGGDPVSGGNGADGTASTWTYDGTTVTLPGGGGGVMVAGGSTVSYNHTANAAGAATNADFWGAGQRGHYGHRPSAATTPCIAGSGGDSRYGQGGSGGLTTSGSASGQSASGYGAGGGGRANGTTTLAGAGANGRPGFWIVEEFS